MVIPVYKKISKHERNLCNNVTDVCESEENKEINELHNSDGDIDASNNLCNQEPLDFPKDLSEGYTVTQVTPSKSKEYWLEKFNKRAAIYKYEVNLSKVEAEVKAIDELAIELIEDYNFKSDEAIKMLLECGIKNPYYL